MRFLFVTGGLEPGRDGVGDYMRQFVDSLQSVGEESGMLALNDHAVASVTTGGQTFERRLPSQMSWRERVELGRAAVREFRPECVVLQFVCYGYHPNFLERPMNRATVVKSEKLCGTILREAALGLREARVRVPLDGQRGSVCGQSVIERGGGFAFP
jgi:hypothetical protein